MHRIHLPVLVVLAAAVGLVACVIAVFAFGSFAAVSVALAIIAAAVIVGAAVAATGAWGFSMSSAIQGLSGAVGGPDRSRDNQRGTNDVVEIDRLALITRKVFVKGARRPGPRGTGPRRR